MASLALDAVLQSVALVERKDAAVPLMRQACVFADKWSDLTAPVRGASAGLAAGTEDSIETSFITASPELPSVDTCLSLAAQRARDRGNLPWHLDTVDYVLFRKYLAATGNLSVAILLEDIVVFRRVKAPGSRLRLVSQRVPLVGLAALCSPSAPLRLWPCHKPA